MEGKGGVQNPGELTHKMEYSKRLAFNDLMQLQIAQTKLLLDIKDLLTSQNLKNTAKAKRRTDEEWVKLMEDSY